MRKQQTLDSNLRTADFGASMANRLASLSNDATPSNEFQLEHLLNLPSFMFLRTDTSWRHSDMLTLALLAASATLSPGKSTVYTERTDFNGAMKSRPSLHSNRHIKPTLAQLRAPQRGPLPVCSPVG